MGDAVIRDIAEAEAQGILVVKRKLFPFQSFFSDALRERAIKAQPPASPIIPTTLVVDGAPAVEQTAGYAIAALPTNETPIAVQFVGAGGGASATYVLAPGQLVRPASRAFTGFRWGLPFGWLGGGVGALVVLKDPQAIVDWCRERPEILFHRFRLPISPGGTSVVGTQQFNLPLRFPWTHARSSVASADYATFNPQQGTPLLAVEPTRTLLRVRVYAPDPMAVRLFFKGTQFEAEKDGGVLPDTSDTFVDINFAGIGTETFGNTSQFPLANLPDAFVRLGGDDASLFAFSATGDSTLDGVFIDVLRFGKLA